MMLCFTCGCCKPVITNRQDNSNYYIRTPNRVYNSCWFHTLKWSLILIFSLLLLAVIVIFVVFPLVFMNSIDLQRKFAFLDVDNPKDPEYTNYLKYHITGVKNDYILVEDDGNLIRLGIWQILPEDQIEASKAPYFSYEKALYESKKPILIFYHGQAASRITNVPKYNLLRKYFHILAFDYRHFADSTEAPLSEVGVVNDAVQLYKNVLKKTRQKDIYIWGHSLGTALGTYTVRKLFESDTLNKPKGLFLESAFSNMRDAVPGHPLGKIFKWLPYFTSTFLDPLERNDFNFDTTTNILHVACPVFIIHAADDNIISARLGEKVFEAAKERKIGDKMQEFHLVPSSYGLSHLKIEEYPKLPSLIENFLKQASTLN